MRNTDSIQASHTTAIYRGGVPAYIAPMRAGGTVSV